MTFRIGQGFDAHRFTVGNEIIIAGVHIPYIHSLQAHSDGDVLLHALCDALLGAAGMPDIGTLFPDTDVAFKGVDSRHLLRDVIQRLETAGWVVGNVDTTLIAQAPKMLPHIPEMRQNIAADIGVAVDAVGIKATTTERMGFAGRGEGIAAMAVVLLTQR